MRHLMPVHATHTPQLATKEKLVARLLFWFAAHARDLPWRRTSDPYAVWVSEIMLQQTQVKTVIPYWNRWMRKLPTIQSAAKASPAKLHKLWEGLGYYTRVRNLQKAARQMLAQHDGKFPENFAAVLALPGIGRYTAGAICSIAFDQPTPILDGNVIRVLTRLYGITTNPRAQKTNSRLWQLAGELVHHASRITHHVTGSRSIARAAGSKGADDPIRLMAIDHRRSPQPILGNCSALNQSLMELGALLCTPRSPDCAGCPVNQLCVARKQNLQEKLPKLAKPSKTTARRFIAFVVERNGRLLVRQRPAGTLNGHLWEFPNLETPAGATPRQLARTFFGRAPTKLEPLATLKHSITRYRITLEAFRAELPNAHPQPDGKWLTRGQLHKLAFTSAHKKILARIGAPSIVSARPIGRH